MTIKSDDRVGRRKAYEAIIKGNPIPNAGMPEAFKVFIKELKGLGLNARLYDQSDKIIDMDELARNSLLEERKTNNRIRTFGQKTAEDGPSAIDEPVVSLEEEKAAAEEEGLSIGKIDLDND